MSAHARAASAGLSLLPPLPQQAADVAAYASHVLNEDPLEVFGEPSPSVELLTPQPAKYDLSLEKRAHAVDLCLQRM